MDFRSSEQTISWIRDRYRDGELIIKPPYQRKPVWAAKQRCFLIESILLNLPVPEVYMQETTSAEGKTVHALVDGQQRIRTVLQFIGADTDPDQQEENKFRLDKLPVNSTWYNAAFSELNDDAKKAFFGYRFQIRHLRTDSDEEVRDMFKRLNKYLTPLNAQELRNATFNGPFITLCNKLAEEDYWVQAGIVTPAAIRRMADIEFVSELLIGVLHGPQGGSDTIVDDYYTTYEDFEGEFPEQRRAEALFAEALMLIQRLFPDIKTHRWSNKTDFYSLFVTIAHLTRNLRLRAKISRLRRSLINFAKTVEARLADENFSAPPEVKQYARAVQRGANDKARRAERHDALMTVIIKATSD
jgi:Protein of unknown function DUF262